MDAVSVVENPSAGRRYGPGIIVRIMSGYIAALNGNAGYAPWSMAHVHAHAEQRAVVAQRGLDVERLLARLARDQQVLVAVLDPLDRSPQVDRGREHGDVLASREHLHPEGAADVLRGDARQRDRIARRGDRAPCG